MATLSRPTPPRQHRSPVRFVSEDLTHIIERFHSIAADVLSAEGLAVHPGLYRYHDAVGTFSGAARYVRYHADLMRLAWAPGEEPVVVDAGCGFGFTMIVAALLGARLVRGIEINAEMAASVAAYLPLLPDEVSQRLHVQCGNVTAMPYPDHSADVILSIEAISHYLYVDAFVAEARRVLRAGGVLVISDGNNGSNPRIRRETYQIWEAAELGPAGQKLGGHILGAPYVEVRLELLREQFPGLDDKVRAEIATRTAGFTEEQLVAACSAYLQTGVLPDSHYRRGKLAIAPDGTAMERLFSPRGLALALERRGFRARAHGYWGGANGVPWVRATNRLLASLSPLTVPAAPAFRVIARKLSNGEPARTPEEAI